MSETCSLTKHARIDKCKDKKDMIALLTSNNIDAA